MVNRRRIELTVAALLVGGALPLLPQAAPPQSAGSKSPGTKTAGNRTAGPHPPAAPAHPITLAQTREMFALMHFQSTMQTMLHENLEQQRARAPFIPNDVWQDFETSFAKVDFSQVFLPVYQKYLSQDDAAQALKFYRTPAGQDTLKVMPALMGEIGQASEQKGEEITKQVLERHRQEIEAAEKKYEQSRAAGAGASQQK